ALQAYDDPVPVLCESWFEEHRITARYIPLASLPNLAKAQQSLVDFVQKNDYEPYLIANDAALQPTLVLPYLERRQELLVHGRDLSITDARPAFLARRGHEAFECLVASRKNRKQALLRVIASERLAAVDFLLFEELPNLTWTRDTWLTWLATDLLTQGWEVFWSDGFSVPISKSTVLPVADT
ncbi:MAG: hypothetical protein ACRESO_00730, partial [Gammaproteobacteria bacterium]